MRSLTPRGIRKHHRGVRHAQRGRPRARRRERPNIGPRWNDNHRRKHDGKRTSRQVCHRRGHPPVEGGRTAVQYLLLHLWIQRSFMEWKATRESFVGNTTLPDTMAHRQNCTERLIETRFDLAKSVTRHEDITPAHAKLFQTAVELLAKGFPCTTRRLPHRSIITATAHDSSRSLSSRAGSRHKRTTN